MHFGYASLQGLPLRRMYYFMQLAEAFTAHSEVNLQMLSAVCGSIDEHIDPGTDHQILGNTPNVVYWFNYIGDRLAPRVTFDDISIHVDKYIIFVCLFLLFISKLSFSRAFISRWQLI